MSNLAFLNRNNTIDIILKNDGVVINHTLITRILLIFDTLTIDSQTAPALFDLTNAGKIVFKPGASALTVGAHSVTVVTYDASNALGVVWNDVGSMTIIVKQV